MRTKKEDQLAKNIGRLSYDTLVEFTRTISKTIEKEISQVFSKANQEVELNLDPYMGFTINVDIIRKEIESHYEQVPLEFGDYIATVETRWQDFNLVLNKINKYPLKNITKQIKQICREKNIEDTNITQLIQEINNAIIRIIIKNTISYEELIYDALYESELEKINLGYYVNNESLKILQPNNYNEYRRIIYLAIKAYHRDMITFINNDSENKKCLDGFFLKMLNSIETLEMVQNKMSEDRDSQQLKPVSAEYPSHIFKNFFAYNMFDDLVKSSKKQEEIGFYFRYMSEKESPKLVVASETNFRRWFNEETQYKIELRNPIKTYNCIKGTESKLRCYDLLKSKHTNFMG